MQLSIVAIYRSRYLLWLIHIGGSGLGSRLKLRFLYYAEISHLVQIQTLIEMYVVGTDLRP